MSIELKVLSPSKQDHINNQLYGGAVTVGCVVNSIQLSGSKIPITLTYPRDYSSSDYLLPINNTLVEIVDQNMERIGF
jgi:hypothetical protein